MTSGEVKMICTNFDKVCSTIGISFGNWGHRHHWGAQNYRWGNFAVEKNMQQSSLASGYFRLPQSKRILIARRIGCSRHFLHIIANETCPRLSSNTNLVILIGQVSGLFCNIGRCGCRKVETEIRE